MRASRGRHRLLAMQSDLHPPGGALHAARAALARGDAPAAAALARDAIDEAPTAAARRALGEALLLGGDRIGARRALLSALAVAIRDLGPDADEVAWVQSALGAASTAIGDLADARDRFAFASTIADGHGDRPELGAALAISQSSLAQASDDLDAAESHVVRALALYAESVGEAAPKAARARRALGSILSRRGRHAEALALLEGAHAALSDALGPDHVDVAVARTSLGAALHRAGRPREAEEAYRAGLAAREAALGRDHPDLAPTLLHLACLADDDGDGNTARALADRAVSVLEGRVVASHPTLVAARARLAQATPTSAPDSSRLPLRLSLP